jgi:cytochrome c biogenesis protein CcdA
LCRWNYLRDAGRCLSFAGLVERGPQKTLIIFRAHPVDATQRKIKHAFAGEHRMKKETKTSISSYLIELLLYSALVFVYFFAVLHFLGAWLSELFHSHRKGYASVALILIIMQGVVLEILTRFLLRFIRLRRED